MSARYGASGASGAALLEQGWLPERAGAALLGISVAALRVLANRGVVRSASIGPAARLYAIGAYAHDARRALDAGCAPRSAP